MVAAVRGMSDEEERQMEERQSEAVVVVSAGTLSRRYWGVMLAAGIVAIIFGTISGVLYPLVRAWARRLDGRGAAALPSREVEERLERIERAVDTIALEVERVSEGQRFVTKLLADKAAATLPAAGE